MRICKRKGIRTLVYHRVTHAHLSQIFSQPAQLQATWRRDGPTFIRVCTILTPQPTKALVLPVFYLSELQRHATNCQSGARDRPLVTMSRRTRHACAQQSTSTLLCFFPPPTNHPRRRRESPALENGREVGAFESGAAGSRGG